LCLEQQWMFMCICAANNNPITIIFGEWRHIMNRQRNPCHVGRRRCFDSSLLMFFHCLLFILIM
jgi:hypothetical protein